MIVEVEGGWVVESSSQAPKSIVWPDGITPRDVAKGDKITVVLSKRPKRTEELTVMYRRFSPDGVTAFVTNKPGNYYG